MPFRLLAHTLVGAVLALTMGPAHSEPTPVKPAGIETGKQFTAADLVSWVLEANAGLAGIRAAAEAAAYRIEPAGSLDDPMLSYGLAPLTSAHSGGPDQKVDVSQKIPWPGTLAARESGARYEAVAADRDADALQLQIVAQAKSAHAEWRFIEDGVAVHHAIEALLDELIATAETRYAAGRGFKQDVLQAEVERADLDNELLRLLRQRAVVRARINALLNRAPDASLPAAGPPPPPTSLPALDQLQSLALSQHPSLARLGAQVSASNSRITLAEKAFYPDFQVGVGYNSLWDNLDKQLVFGVAINVPIDRSKRRSELGRARADARRAEWSLLDRRANLLAELAQVHAEVVEAQASVALYQERLAPLAVEYLEAALADYQSGTGAFLNVITAEKRKLRTDLALARARADYARRLAELERWVGGSMEPARAAIPGADK